MAGGGFRIEGGEAATARLLASDGRPGLVVANNLMTIGALRAMRAAGVVVPADLALVAIDDPLWAELTDPPLTTLAQPVRRMADERHRSCCSNEIEGADAVRVVLPIELASALHCGCGAPAADGAR